MKQYCEYCKKVVTYTVANERVCERLKGNEYYFSGKVARCSECGGVIFDSQVQDYNLDKLYEEYCRENRIIEKEKICELLERYQIGKRPMSLVLGWGELTFTRYCDGDIPTREYSEKLYRIYESPEFFLQLLDDSRNRISSIAYEKARKAAEKLIENALVNTSTLFCCARYLLCVCKDVTPLALQKLLYYVQGFCYAFTGKFIFEEDCEAWVHGPVYRDVYNAYKDYHYSFIDNPGCENELVIGGVEKLVVDSVAKYFNRYSGTVLMKLTHKEKPWIETRKGLLPEEGSNRVIPKNLISDFFLELKNRYHMQHPDDISKYIDKVA